MALADTLKVEKIVKLPWWQKAAIVGGLAAVIILLYFFFIDTKYTDQIDKLNNDIAALDKNITDLKTIEKDLPKFERQNAMLKKELEKAMTKLPSTAQIDELLKDVTIKAMANGVEVGTFDRQTDVTQSLYVEVPVNMKLKAGFFPLMIFWNELARMERIVNVSGITMKGNKKDSSLDVTCTLTAYRFKETPAATDTTKPAGKGKAKKVTTGGEE